MTPFNGTMPHRPMATYGPNTVVKRKFRWTLEVRCPQTNQIVVPKDFVKMAARPELKIEETELDFLNKKSWIPGKQSWDVITCTYWDAANSDGAHFMTKLVEAGMKASSGQPTILATPKHTYVLELWDGMGCLLERWNLLDGFVTSVNFGEMDFNSDEATLELQIRYSQVKYESNGVGDTWSPSSLPGHLTEEWKEPEEWKIKTPIQDVTESSSPGERVLDQFLRRLPSRSQSRTS